MKLKVPPFAHQKAAAQQCWRATRFALLAEARTGKTYITLMKAAGHFERGEIDTLLIFARNGIHRAWIEKHIPEFFPDEVPYVANHYSSGHQRNAWKEAVKQDPSKLRILAINIEAVAHSSGQVLVRELMKGRKCMVIVDESHRISTPKSKRTRAMWHIGKKAVIAMILTGTPTKKGFENLYAQYRFLDVDIIGAQTYTEFKELYCRITSFGLFEKITGYQNLEFLFARIKPFTFQVLRRDCFDLPPIQFTRIPVVLTDLQKKLYRDVRLTSLAELDQGKWMRVDGGGVKIMRLQQIVCGIITLDDGTVELIPTNREDAILEIFNNETEKGIIWCRFQEDIERVYAALKKEGIGCVTHYGPDSSKARDKARDRFDHDDDVRAIIATTDTLCENYNLNVAGWMCFYSNNFKPDQREQAVARNQADGQTKKLVVYDLEAERTVDTKIIAAHETAAGFAELLRDQREVRKWLELDPD